MGGQLKVKDTEIDDEIFGCRYGGLEDLKGIFIRAAIAYLNDLSSKNISSKVLVNEGIIDERDTTDVDEVVIITNYRLRIDSALRLLQSWCREKTGDGKPDLIAMGVMKPTETSDFRRLLSRPHPSFEPPVEGSILPPSFRPDAMSMKWLDDANLNYRMHRIPRAMPPVLKELNLKGVHHYVAHCGEFSYEKSQDIVAFLDKMKPYIQFGGEEWESEYGPIDEQLRTVFAGCKPGNVVTLD
jgi:hypothetical protein